MPKLKPTCRRTKRKTAGVRGVSPVGGKSPLLIILCVFTIMLQIIFIKLYTCLNCCRVFMSVSPFLQLVILFGAWQLQLQFRWNTPLHVWRWTPRRQLWGGRLVSSWSVSEQRLVSTKLLHRFLLLWLSTGHYWRELQRGGCVLADGRVSQRWNVSDFARRRLQLQLCGQLHR